MDENKTEENVDTPSEALPGDDDVVSSDGEETVTNDDSISLSELNEMLGRTYKDKESAIKSLKDTRAAATKAGELEKKLQEVAPDAALADEVRQLKEDSFYARHPEYESMKDVIKSMGENPADVVETDAFKNVFEQVQGYQKAQQSKSVLETNPRLSQVRDSMTQAKDLVKKARESLSQGDVSSAVQQQTQAASKAVGSVLDAYEADKL